MPCRVFVTIDLDWASEVVIEETLDWFKTENIPITVFATHKSKVVEDNMDDVEVGLHPYFSSDSSQGSNPDETIETLKQIPINVPIYRSHRFLDSNQIREEMLSLGITASSNVCTNLDPVNPFLHRSGMIEIPISLEDGSYLENGYDLNNIQHILKLISVTDIFVIAIHPMHFILNTPFYQWMRDIKDSTTRESWNNLQVDEINKLRNNEIGISSFVKELITNLKASGYKFEFLSDLIH